MMRTGGIVFFARSLFPALGFSLRLDAVLVIQTAQSRGRRRICALHSVLSLVSETNYLIAPIRSRYALRSPPRQFIGLQ